MFSTAPLPGHPGQDRDITETLPRNIESTGLWGRRRPGEKGCQTGVQGGRSLRDVNEGESLVTGRHVVTWKWSLTGRGVMGVGCDLVGDLCHLW